VPRGYYSVLRYVPDPARNEPVNIGIVITGPSGGLCQFDDRALERAKAQDPFVDRPGLEHLKHYFAELVESPRTAFRQGMVVTAAPHEPAFLTLIRDMHFEQLSVSEPLQVELLDESRGSMEEAVKDLVGRLVVPLKGRPRFIVRDPTAPVEILRRQLQPLIQRRWVLEQPQFQGWSRRLRTPDLAYFRPGRVAVVIENVRLNLKRERTIFEHADASAFEIYDIRRALEERNGGDVIAVLHLPPEPSETVEEALLSIRSVASRVVDPREEGSVDRLARQIKTEASAA
jgi:hypothetical protein